MCTGEHFHVAVAVYRESAHVAVIALQIAEALDGYTRGAGNELQQLGLLLLFVPAHELPEPQDHLVAGAVCELACANVGRKICRTVYI